MERAIGRWHQRRSDADTRGWMFTVLHNLVQTRLRRQLQRLAHLHLDQVADAALSTPGTPEARLQYRDLLAALAELSDDQRAVILLIAVEDLSYAETAEVLGVPLVIVMLRLARARPEPATPRFSGWRRRSGVCARPACPMRGARRHSRMSKPGPG
ncbi:RNA polymerase sigma factor [Paracoccus laeviglucosivorans]|uniref:RNA polymerase sigma-70 factor, ECF subfamily n=1 Tax=Paracoccus laeviglucosivorans TaxID=1197861 RepID=A0A521FTR4_9RHOB|nr:RNA polymerase sigma factor [Paracoccus laeviglucosivorans]SMO98921.1 RNA polymerase sigma-70 factor, ECF subfamily [Paracoccus laeviglucosivorans]